MTSTTLKESSPESAPNTWSLLKLLAGPAAFALIRGHSLVTWLDRALPIWVVPPAVMFLLFTIPTSGGSGGTLLSWRDAEKHTPWSTIILVLGAVAMTEAITKFGSSISSAASCRASVLDPRRCRTSRRSLSR